MVDRRVSMVVSGMLAFVALAALWSAFVRPARRVKAGSVPDAPVVAVPSESTATGAPPVATPAPVSPAPAPAPAATVVPGADAGGPSYIVLDRKSTRLNSSHMSISYAVFCLKKKKKQRPTTPSHTQHQITLTKKPSDRLSWIALFSLPTISLRT